MRTRPQPLPRFAEEFLRTAAGKSAGPAVRLFHRWLSHKPVALSGLRPEEVDQFFAQPFRQLVSPRTAQHYKRRLIGYLAWLHARGWLGFHPRQLGVRHRRPLPPVTLDFLRSLEPTHRPSTCRGYRTTLQSFHEWLDDAGLQVKRLTRPQIEQWLLALNDRGLHASTRLHAIQHVRSYLRWLFERGELRRSDEELVRGSDLPKLPQYLPRPLAPDVDLELQRRLGDAPYRVWQGLFLMRLTGLRVGELAALEYDCVRADADGNRFLKVPLGKLYSERLVPIDERAWRIIERQRQAGDPSRRYLIDGSGGRPVEYARYREALLEAVHGLGDRGRITTHQLRHTYATSLLNAGMSLVGVMKLLGHRDYRMTLRYTAITQETVGKEYYEALTRLQDRYTALHANQGETPDPLKAISDVVAWVKNHLEHERGAAPRARAITKRLLRIREALLPHVPGTSGRE